MASAWFTSWAFPLVIPLSITIADSISPVWKSVIPQLKIQRQVRKIEWATISYIATTAISWYFLQRDGYVFSRLWSTPLIVVSVYSFYCFTNDDYMISQYVYDNSDRVIEAEIEKQRLASRIQLILMFLCQSIVAVGLYPRT